MLFPLTDIKKSLYLPLPGLGFLYPFYRTAFGAKQDLPHPLYQRFKDEVLEALKGYDNVLIASGHEHALQYFQVDQNHFIVSGSGSKSSQLRKDKDAQFSSEKKGFSRVSFYDDGSADLEFIVINGTDVKTPFSREIISKSIALPIRSKPYDVSSSTKRDKASPIYNTSNFHQLLFGKTYRADWNTEVEVRNLNLSKEHGGLVPIKKGGGFSSNSLRLRHLTKSNMYLDLFKKVLLK
tara:strand:- start:161 stop:871 length:711 start_codon:yes stop_codon:yes gene_type:complete